VIDLGGLVEVADEIVVDESDRGFTSDRLSGGLELNGSVSTRLISRLWIAACLRRVRLVCLCETTIMWMLWVGERCIASTLQTSHMFLYR
jgi:hypothetical protein